MDRNEAHYFGADGGGGGGSGAATGQNPLVGGAGADYAADLLQRMHPQQAIERIQQEAALDNPLCVPLLQLSDQLGLSRLEAHRSILQQAKREFLSRIDVLKPELQDKTLALAFPYVGIGELREIPFKIMEKMDEVPSNFLKQLAADRQIFKELSPKVQRQVWESDRNLLYQDAIPLIASYKYEVATVMASLRMAAYLRPVQQEHTAHKGEESDDDGRGQHRTKAMRKQLRSGSKSIRGLREMVGGSVIICGNIANLCRLKYRDSDTLYEGIRETSYCMLRSQLLMALHDDGNVSITNADKSFELAWILDACINKGRISPEHLNRMRAMLDPYDAPARRGRGAAHTAAMQHGDSGSDDERGSGGGSPGEKPKVLADMGMAIRDPPAFHLLLAEVVQQMHMCVQRMSLPRHNVELVFLLRMLQLGVDCRTMMRNQQYYFPNVPSELLRTLYPRLAAALLHGERDCAKMLAPVLPQASDITAYLPKNVVGRQVVQMLTLERLKAKDLTTSKMLLEALRDTFNPNALPEYAPFVQSLAARMSVLVSSGKVAPGDGFWKLAVEEILMPSVDAHPQVHEEVLRLLIAASSEHLKAARLDPQLTAQYLAQALEHTSHSRRKAKKRRLEPEDYALPGGVASPDHSMLPEDDMPAGGGGDGWSDGWPMVRALKFRSADSLRAVYQLVMTKVPALKNLRDHALLDYMNSGQ